jgi:hypothetical protein
MFEATFLGHQGWLFSSGDACIAVDPILTEDFCDAGRVGRMFPPREFVFSRFPRLNAVVITHEHNDHFAIPTLHRMDRGIPIHLSMRSSVGARGVLEEMGFAVTLLSPGARVTAGSLELHAFSPDHTASDNYDEWDVLPYVVRDRGGHGNFFTHVDVEPSERADQAMRSVAGFPGLWGCTNNATNWSFTKAGALRKEPPPDSLALATLFMQQYSALRHRWGAPAGVLCCGGGLSFAGDRCWLNRNVFMASSERAFAAISAVVPDQFTLVPRPGQTVHMAAGKIVRITNETDYLRPAPRPDWPSRNFEGDVSLMEHYAPACGRRAFDPEDLPELVRELDGFAQYLYGSGVFRALYSCDDREVGARRPTFVLALLADSGAYVFEYNPQACCFVLTASRDPVNDYLSGMELWATDFLAVSRGELGSSAIPFGRARVWNAAPDRCLLSFREFCMYFHPLRRPGAFLNLYRRLWRAQPAMEPLVRAA